MNFTEDNFISWSKGPSQTEKDKCENAEGMVRKAIKASAALQSLDISVFAQGSYRARTNVRLNSDVDICVRYNGSFFPDYPNGKTKSDFGNVDGTFPFADFKNLVQEALESYFGKDGVTRGNKAFDVHANTYRIDADVVPTFEHRRYTGRRLSDGSDEILFGVAFQPDKGPLIKNWPQQNYENGVAKNDATGRRYKRVIRILKRLRDRMNDDNIPAAKGVSSFLIECLVWNCEEGHLQHERYTDTLRNTLVYLWGQTKEEDPCSEWGEVNELKYLFRPSQPWDREQANSFLAAAFNYIGYK